MRPFLLLLLAFVAAFIPLALIFNPIFASILAAEATVGEFAFLSYARESIRTGSWRP